MAGNPLRIEHSSRVLVVGQTGSGKSTLVQYMLLPLRNLVIVDPKHQFDPIQRHEIVTTAEELETEGNRRTSRNIALVFRPSMEYLDSGEIDEVYGWIFARGNTILYNDELTTIIPNAARYPSKLRAIHTQGRGKGITCIEATQRPSGIPGWIYSETDLFIKFSLATRDDQKRMAQYMGDTVVEPASYPAESAHASKHTFYVYRQGEREPAREYVLDLSNGTETPDDGEDEEDNE